MREWRVEVDLRKFSMRQYEMHRQNESLLGVSIAANAPLASFNFHLFFIFFSGEIAPLSLLHSRGNIFLSFRRTRRNALRRVGAKKKFH